MKAGTYTASITAGEGNDKVTATVKYTIAQAQLTVTKATVENRRYDGTSKVNATGVTLAGIIGNDTVSVDTTGLQGTLKVPMQEVTRKSHCHSLCLQEVMQLTISLFSRIRRSHLPVML